MMKKNNPWLRASVCGLLCLPVMLLLTALCTKLIESGVLPFSFATLLSYGILAISALSGCLASGLSAGKYLLPRTALSAAVYFLILCVLNGILLRGQFRALLPTAGIVFGASLLAALLAAGRRKSSFG